MDQLRFERFLSHDGTELAYRTRGRGRRVVLIHGLTVSSTANFATHYEDDGAGGLVATPGPTIESALVDAGCEVALFDLRGHAHSEKPHDPVRYSMDAFAGDARAFVNHLGWSETAVVGYSFGAMIAERLLGEAGVSRVALCGIGSWQVEGEGTDFEASNADGARCFLEDAWDEVPEFAVLRTWADLSDSDYQALGLIFAHGMRAIAPEELKVASVPVLVLNGGGDGGAVDSADLTPFIPGARRAVAGVCHHGTAPSDPLFQAELVRFLTEEP